MPGFIDSRDHWAPQATPGWYWVVPRISVALLFLAVGALLWQLHRTDIEEQRLTLISDALWVEQNLRFHVIKVEDVLDELGRDAADGRMDPGQAETRFPFLTKTNPWLIQIIWYDAEAKPIAAAPPRIGEYAVGETAGTFPSIDTFGFARSLGKPVFSQPYPAVNADYHVEVHVPQFRKGRLAHMMVGVVSLNTLLREAVPWWYAEKYRLQVVDDGGTVLATKSKVDAGGAGLSYSVAFDPPGRGLLLQATAYKSETSLLRNVLAASIITLTLGILWSLWALRRHMQQRLKAEQALRNEHSFRKAMEDSLLTGLRARDLDGRIVYVNPAFCRMTGFSAAELIGRKPPMPYWAPEEYETTLAVHQKVLAGLAPSEGVEVRLQRKNGERFEALIYEAPLIDAEGRHTGWMGSVLDVTERKRTEELARQQQEKLQFTARLVTMGEMASTLAHEINQPLSAIASYTTGCLNRLEAGDLPRNELREALDKLASQAQRAGRIIRRVYDFVRRSSPQRAPCRINAVIGEAVGLIEADARKRGVRILTDLAEGLPELLADRVMLEQVLLNLMRNGMDAMEGTAAEDRQLVVGTAQAGGAVLVSVADRGAGIPPEAAQHLFEPFFSTKVEGMGMGLNICRSIVEFHEGRMWVETNPEGGTIFRFTLPAQPA